MRRLPLVLCLLSVLSLSACEWEGRPDGMAPNNEAEMRFEPSEASDGVEEIELGDAEIVEPLDGEVPPGADAPAVRDAPLTPDVTASDRQLDANADAGDRDTPMSDQ